MSAPVRVRVLSSSDVEDAAAVLKDAFDVVYRRRGHTPPFPSHDSAAWLCRAYLDLDPRGALLAVRGSDAVGVGFVHNRGAVASIGPLAARPGESPGVGRALMSELLRACAGVGSVRLFQDAFNPDSFGLYTRLGFRVGDVAPYLVSEAMHPPLDTPAHVRGLTEGDMTAVAAFDKARVGSDRMRDLALLAASGSALLHESTAGVLGGYLFFRALPTRVIIGPGIADDEVVLNALVDAVAAALPGKPAALRASARSSALVSHAFTRGFHVDHLANLMVLGAFAPPACQLYALFPESL